jgi:hypothetical protein
MINKKPIKYIDDNLIRLINNINKRITTLSMNISNVSSNNITLEVVKSDTDIATAISSSHQSGSDNQDLSNLVVKETGKSLISDILISDIHAPGSDNQDLSSYVQTNDSRLTDAREPLIHVHDNYEPANVNIQSHISSTHLQFSGLTKITVGDTAPINPSVGDLWISTI